MNCSFCRTPNRDDEHRCRRCGRRLTASPNDTSSEFALPQTAGALAAAPQPARAGHQAPVGKPGTAASRQGTLFAERAAADKPLSKVIPFESFAASRIEPPPAPKFEIPKPAPPPPPAAAKPPQARRGAARASVTQQRLDFLPPAPQARRTLKTSVPAVIYCEAPVATPLHRSVAAGLDAAMVLIAFGLFVSTFQLAGGAFEISRPMLMAFGGSFVLIAFFYGLIWVLGSSETPGMRWTDLRLINFDGFPPERGQRFLRFAGTCLSFCTFGLGLLWALADEESLTWQDHISKTFPTLRERHSNFFRKR